MVANPVRPHAATAVDALTKRATALSLPRPRVRWTRSGDHGSRAAREAVAEGAAVVVVAGGDGTIRQVAGVLAGTGTQMAILPVGRGNVLAHNMGMRRLPKPVLLDIALTGRSTRIGVGCARVVDAGGAHQEPFLTMAGLGNDAMAIATMRGAGGWQDYFVAGLRRLLAPELEFVVSVDGAEEPLWAWSVFVGAQPGVPPGIELFPGAGGPGGRLVVAGVRPGSLTGWGRVALDRVRRMPSNPWYCYRRASEVVLRPSVPLPLHLDGDVLPDVTLLSAVGGRGFLRLRNVLGPGVPLG